MRCIWGNRPADVNMAILILAITWLILAKLYVKTEFRIQIIARDASAILDTNSQIMDNAERFHVL